MTDMNAKTAEEKESFAALFEQSEAQQTDLSNGSYVKGTIVEVGEENIFVNIGAKSDGIIKREELADAEGNVNVSEGDEIEAFILSRKAGEIILTKTLSGKAGDKGLSEAYKHRIPVEGKIVAVVKGGFTVKMMGKNAFCPISQVDTEYVENPETYKGRTLEFVITKFEGNGRNIVVSRSELLRKKQTERLKELIENFSEGAVVDGTVQKVAPFGVFIDIGGIDGLCRLSELSYGRIENPESVFPQGTKLQVKILSIEQPEKEEGKREPRPRILLSVKQVGTDPWESASQKFETGKVYNGRVVDVKNFGAFVELAPGLEGLVHVSEMSWMKRVNHPNELVKKGDTVSVVVQSIAFDSKRISLSMKEVHGNPWDEAERKYLPNKIVKGKVERKADFGYFIELEPGIVGLLPSSKLKGVTDKKYSTIENGNELTVKIIDIQADKGKVTLGPVLENGEDMGDTWKKYVDSDDNAMGVLGEKLKEVFGDMKK